MKLNTHDRTPRPKNSTLITVLFLICVILIYGIFNLISFACFYYAQSFVGGIFLMLIPLLLTTLMLIHINDMEKAYVEIKEHEICVVDYHWGIKKEKKVAFSDITSAEIHPGYSHQVKGLRFSHGVSYIVFKKDGNYLFKIIHLPQTEEIFKQYLR